MSGGQPMWRSQPYRTPLLLGLTALSLFLSACGGSSSTPSATASPAPQLTVPNLPAGQYRVSVGEDEQLQMGLYFSLSDGSRALLLQDAAANTTALYQQQAGQWQRIPAASGTAALQFSLEQGASLPASDLAAGRYIAQYKGQNLAWQLNAQGEISAASGSSCALSGKVAAPAANGLRALQLKLAQCAGLPAELTGWVVSDPEDQPAQQRWVLHDGRTLYEWLAISDDR